MAHFAQIDENNIVLQILVVDNKDIMDENGVEHEHLGITFLQNLLGANTRWVQTSYNSKFRKNYAGIGSIWLENGPSGPGFTTVKPYTSWIFNSENYSWDPPTPIPNDGNDYAWDENNLSWVKIEF